MNSSTIMSEYKIVKLNPDLPDMAIINEVSSLLENGKLIVAPTETSYGLLARVDRQDSMNNLFNLKGRTQEKPTALFVPDLDTLEQLAEFDSVAKELCLKFLPGPLTIVLKAKIDFGKYVTVTGKTGFRISSSPVIREIMKRQDVPVTATSANLSGETTPKKITEISQKLGDNVGIYLDCGILNNLPSTVVEVIDGTVNILRESAISSEQILKTVRNI